MVSSFRAFCLTSLCLISLCQGARSEGLLTPPLDLFYEDASGIPILSLIKSATQTIDIEIYTMKDAQVISALTLAVGRGVKLRIVQTPNPLDPCKIFDPIASGDDANCQVLKRFVPFVRSHSGSYVPFSSSLCGTPGANCFQHGKILIVDSKNILLSTGNFDPTNLCDTVQNPTNCNRDYSVISRDSDVISTIQSIFNQDIVGARSDLNAILHSPAAKRVTVSPDSLAPLVSFIQSAKKSIQLENQYLKDPTFNQALIDAAKRGVKVFVMVSSVTAFGKLDPIQDTGAISQWKATYTAFDQAGIHTRIFDGSMTVNGVKGYLHAKAILVDGIHSWIGSVNGSTMSLSQNREYGLFSDDAKVIQALGVFLYNDFTDKNSESWQESLVGKKD